MPPASVRTTPQNAGVGDTQSELLLFDFADPDAVAAWSPIDDRVMGGISCSRLRYDPSGNAVFEGTVSLERNGGFASVRSAPGARGKTGAVDCLLEVRGDAKRFKLNLLTEDAFVGLNYQSSFTPKPGDWKIFRIVLAAFCPTFRGRELQGVPALDSARIRQVGLMIADRQAGPFTLAVRRISLA